MILVKTGPAVLEKKVFKNCKILYMYTTQEQGQITPGDEILIVTLVTHCKFQPLVFNTF